jgi:hypothetical protein
LSFWRAAAHLLVEVVHPRLVQMSPDHIATQALYTSLCRLSASQMDALMDMSSNQPTSDSEARQRQKNPLKYGLPPAALQDLFSAGIKALGVCRGYSQGSFADPFTAWVAVLRSEIAKRKHTQSKTVTEDVLQRIRPAAVLWLPTPSTSSNALRDELAGFVGEACTSEKVSLDALEVLNKNLKDEHPYPSAAQLSPYNIGALVSERGEKIFSADTQDSDVWMWAVKERRIRSTRNLFQGLDDADMERDPWLSDLLCRLLVTNIPRQSTAQDAAAWVITSRFLTYPTSGTIVSERKDTESVGATSTGEERLACILLHLRFLCSGSNLGNVPDTAVLWKEALKLADTLRDPKFADHLSYSFEMFNGLVCAVARSFVSIALDHMHLGRHSAKLSQVLPEDVGRVVADILTARRDRGRTNAFSGPPITASLALNALSLATGQGSVRELRNTMRTAASIYASSLYAERVAAGVDWIASSVAGRLFRLSFTSREIDKSLAAEAILACREFVAKEETLANCDTILSSLRHAISNPCIPFIRESAMDRQVFAIVSQTAETCDLVTALMDAGVSCDGVEKGCGTGGCALISPSVSQELPPLSTQLREGCDSKSASVPAVPVITEKFGKLSNIRCHSIWANLRTSLPTTGGGDVDTLSSIDARRSRGSKDDDEDGIHNDFVADSDADDWASTNNADEIEKLNTNDIKNDKNRRRVGTMHIADEEGKVDPLSILVCLGTRDLTMVGQDAPNSATFLCGSCRGNRVQTAIATWLCSRKRWCEEIKLLVSTSTVQKLVTHSLQLMRLRCGSTTVGRGPRQDIQRFFNNMPSSKKNSCPPARARVVYNGNVRRCTVDLTSPASAESLDSDSELVLPRTNDRVSAFLKPAEGSKSKKVPLMEEAKRLAKLYLSLLTVGDKHLPRKDCRLLYENLTMLCSRRSSDRHVIASLNSIYRISPVLESLRSQHGAATSLLAAALEADRTPKVAMKTGKHAPGRDEGTIESSASRSSDVDVVDDSKGQRHSSQRVVDEKHDLDYEDLGGRCGSAATCVKKENEDTVVVSSRQQADTRLHQGELETAMVAANTSEMDDEALLQHLRSHPELRRSMLASFPSMIGSAETAAVSTAPSYRAHPDTHRVKPTARNSRALQIEEGKDSDRVRHESKKQKR